MKKTKVFCKFICALLILVQFALPVVATEVETTAPVEEPEFSSMAGCYSADATSSMLGAQKLIEDTESAFVYEVNTQTLMYAYNPDAQLDPSSLVKLMTALIAVEEGNLQDNVTVKQATLDTVPDDAVSAKLQADEVISLENLLYCMIVGSANDAAAVIAEHIYGSQEAFVDRMNQRAAELGCTGSNFLNVHGIYTDGQVMSARDVAKIMEIAVANETFVTIFGTAYYTVPETNKSMERDLSTGNYMCNTDSTYYDTRVVGGRTGTARNGTRCLSVLAEDNGMRLVCVVMGSKPVIADDGYTILIAGGFNETKTLLDAGFSGYKAAQLFYDGQALVNWSVSGGENMVTGGPKTAITSVLPADATVDKLTYRYDINQYALSAPIAAGDKLCTVEIWYGNLCVAQTDLYAMNDVRVAGHVQQAETTNNGGNFAWIWILAVILVVVVVVVLVFKTKSKAGRRKDKRHIRRRKEAE